MPGDDDQFRVGALLWVDFEGFPWWPCRVISPEDITSLKQERKPVKVPPNKVLVCFFNDNQRWCVIDKTATRPLCDDKFLKLRLTSRGKYHKAIIAGVREAFEFAGIDVDVDVVASSRPKTAARRSVSPTFDDERERQPKASRRRSFDRSRRSDADARQPSNPSKKASNDAPSNANQSHAQLGSTGKDSNGTEDDVEVRPAAGRRRHKEESRSRSNESLPDPVPKSRKRPPPANDTRADRSVRERDGIRPAQSSKSKAAASTISDADAGDDVKAKESSRVNDESNSRRLGLGDEKYITSKSRLAKHSSDSEGDIGKNGSAVSLPRTKRRRSYETVRKGLAKDAASEVPIEKTGQAGESSTSKRVKSEAVVSPTPTEGDVEVGEKGGRNAIPSKNSKQESAITGMTPSKSEPGDPSNDNGSPTDSKRDQSKAIQKKEDVEGYSPQKMASKSHSVGRLSTGGKVAPEVGMRETVKATGSSDGDKAEEDKDMRGQKRDRMKAAERNLVGDANGPVLDKSDECGSSDVREFGRAGNEHNNGVDGSDDGFGKANTPCSMERKKGEPFQPKRRLVPTSPYGDANGRDRERDDGTTDRSTDGGENAVDDSFRSRKKRRRKQDALRDSRRRRRFDKERIAMTSIDFEPIADYVPADALIKSYEELSRDALVDLLLHREEELSRCRASMWRAKCELARRLATQDDVEYVFSELAGRVNNLCKTVAQKVKAHATPETLDIRPFYKLIDSLPVADKEECLKLEEDLCRIAHSMRRMYFDLNRVDITVIARLLASSTKDLVKYSKRGSKACSDLASLWTDLYLMKSMEEDIKRKQGKKCEAQLREHQVRTSNSLSSDEIEEDDGKKDTAAGRGCTSVVDMAAVADSHVDGDSDVVTMDTDDSPKKKKHEIEKGDEVSDAVMKGEDPEASRGKMKDGDVNQVKTSDVEDIEYCNRGDGKEHTPEEVHGKSAAGSPERDTAKENEAKADTNDPAMSPSHRADICAAREELRKDRRKDCDSSRKHDQTMGKHKGSGGTGSEYGGNSDEQRSSSRKEAHLGEERSGGTGGEGKYDGKAKRERKIQQRQGIEDGGTGSGGCGDEERGYAKERVRGDETGVDEAGWEEETERSDRRRRGGVREKWKGVRSSGAANEATERMTQNDSSTGNSWRTGNNDDRSGITERKERYEGKKGASNDGGSLSNGAAEALSKLLGNLKSWLHPNSAPKGFRKLLVDTVQSEILARRGSRKRGSDADMVIAISRLLQQNAQKMRKENGGERSGNGSAPDSPLPFLIQEAIESFIRDDGKAQVALRRLVSYLFGETSK